MIMGDQSRTERAGETGREEASKALYDDGKGGRTTSDWLVDMRKAARQTGGAQGLKVLIGKKISFDEQTLYDENEFAQLIRDLFRKRSRHLSDKWFEIAPVPGMQNVQPQLLQAQIKKKLTGTGVLHFNLAVAEIEDEILENYENSVVKSSKLGEFIQEQIESEESVNIKLLAIHEYIQKYCKQGK